MSVTSPTGPAALQVTKHSEQFGVFNPLPRDVLLYLLTFIGIRDQMTVSLLSRSLRQVAEDPKTSLGKLKRAFRVFNGNCEVRELPMDRRYVTLFSSGGQRCWLIKQDHEKSTRVEVFHPHFVDEPAYWVSPTLFVQRSDARVWHYHKIDKWSSHRIDYERMSLTSTDLPTLPSASHHPEEVVDCSQQENCLQLEIKSVSASVFHFFTYVISEQKGPDSLYLGQPESHVIFRGQRTNGFLFYSGMQSIERVEQKQDQEIVTWSRTEIPPFLNKVKIRENWLVMISGNEGQEFLNLRYHFIDLNSGHTMYNYDFVSDRDSLFWGVYRGLESSAFILKNNICVITRRDHATEGLGVAATTVLQLELKKSIPLSYRAMESLKLLALPTGGNQLKTFERINCNFTGDHVFFQIEDSGYDHQRFQVQFSGNPNITFSTPHSDRPPLSLRIRHLLRLIPAITSAILLLLTCAGLVVSAIFYTFIAFKAGLRLGAKLISQIKPRNK